MTKALTLEIPGHAVAFASLLGGMGLATVLTPATSQALFVLALFWILPILLGAAIGRICVTLAYFAACGAVVYLWGQGIGWGSEGTWLDPDFWQKIILLTLSAVLGHTAFSPTKKARVAKGVSSKRKTRSIRSAGPATQQPFPWNSNFSNMNIGNVSREQSSKWKPVKDTPLQLSMTDLLPKPRPTLDSKADLDTLRRASFELASRSRNALGAIHEAMGTLVHRLSPSLELDNFMILAESELTRLHETIALFGELMTPPAIAPAAQSINDTVETAVGQFSKSNPEVNIQLDLNPDYPTVSLTKVAIQKAVSALLQNAMEANALKTAEQAGEPPQDLPPDSKRENNRIEVEIFSREKLVVVAVHDHGEGVPSSIRDRITHPFVSTKSGSHGMGLAICHKVLKDCGGNLAFVSTPGQGSTFKLLIPFVQAATASAEKIKKTDP